MRKNVSPIVAVVVIITAIAVIGSMFFVKSSSTKSAEPDPKSRHSQIGSKEAAESIRNRIIERQKGQQ